MLTYKEIVRKTAEMFIGHPEHHTIGKAEFRHPNPDVPVRYCLVGGVGSIVGENTDIDEWDEALIFLRESLDKHDEEKLKAIYRSDECVDCCAGIEDGFITGADSDVLVDINDRLGFKAVERLLQRAVERINNDDKRV